MNKYTEIYGVDISKVVFDVYGSKTGHKQFKNDAQGFKIFLKHLPKGALVVMEATGYYHYRLAQFLFKTSLIKKSFSNSSISISFTFILFKRIPDLIPTYSVVES